MDPFYLIMLIIITVGIFYYFLVAASVKKTEGTGNRPPCCRSSAYDQFLFGKTAPRTVCFEQHPNLRVSYFYLRLADSDQGKIPGGLTWRPRW